MKNKKGFGKTISIMLLAIVAIIVWTAIGVNSDEIIAEDEFIAEKAALPKLITEKAALPKLIAEKAALPKMITTTPNKDSVVINYKAVPRTDVVKVSPARVIKNSNTELLEDYAIRGALSSLCAKRFPNRKKAYDAVAQHHLDLILQQGHKPNEYESIVTVSLFTYSYLSKSSIAKECKQLRLTYASN